MHSTTTFSSLPWLAYCSSAYLAREAPSGVGASPPPWLFALKDPLAKIYGMRYDVLAGSPRLPARMEFRPDPELINDLLRKAKNGFPAMSDSERDRFLLHLSSYYARITEAEGVYSVSKTTNVAGHLVPLEFELQMFRFKSPRGARSNEAMTRISAELIRGRLESVEQTTQFVPLPIPSPSAREIRVADYRFYNESNRVYFLRYVASSGGWITNKSDPRLASLYKIAMEKSRNRKTAPAFPKAVVGAVLSSLVLLPLCSGRMRSYAAMAWRQSRL